MNNVALPKWPQMRVSGKSVTVEQAKDIIFKTDLFLTSAGEWAGGNNHKFNTQYRHQAGLVKPDSSVFTKYGAFSSGMFSPNENALSNTAEVNAEIDDEIGECSPAERKSFFERLAGAFWEFTLEEEVRERLGILVLNYMDNNHASTSYVYGPNGWCWPDGTIYFSANIGKWPSIEEVHKEWQLIAETFPYLDLHVTLMSGEHCEEDIKPLVNLRIVGGVATVCEPDLSVHTPVNLTFDHTKESPDWPKRMFDDDFGIGLPYEWYDDYAKIVRKTVEEIFSEANSYRTDSAGSSTSSDLGNGQES